MVRKEQSLKAAEGLLHRQARERVVVLKFGGTTSGSHARIREARHLIEKKLTSGYHVVSVFSAIRSPAISITNLLVNFREVIGRGANEKNSMSPPRQGVEELRRLILEPHLELMRDLGLLSNEALENAIDKGLDRICGQSNKPLTFLLSETERLVLHALALYRMPLQGVASGVDYLVSGGERLVVSIISEYLNQKWYRSYFPRRWGYHKTFRAQAACAGDLDILTDDTYGNATIDSESLRRTKYIIKKNYFDLGLVPIVTGFDGIYKDRDTGRRHVTTLGRGGSDYTATFLGLALDAEATYLLKDTPGVLSANPKFVKKPYSIPYLSYELAVAAGNIQEKSIQPAKQGDIPIIIFDPRDPSAKTEIRASRVTARGPILIGDPFEVRSLLIEGSTGQDLVLNTFQTMLNFGLEIVEFSGTNEGLLIVWKQSGYKDSMESFINKHFRLGSSRRGYYFQLAGNIEKDDFMKFSSFVLSKGALSPGAFWRGSRLLTATIPCSEILSIPDLLAEVHERIIRPSTRALREVT